MALGLFAKLAQELFYRAKAEARTCARSLSTEEREREVIRVAHENLRRSRSLWYRVRDEVGTRNRVFILIASEYGPEKQYAPESIMDLGFWFADQFLDGHSFFVERRDGTAGTLGVADPIHVS